MNQDASRVDDAGTIGGSAHVCEGLHWKAEWQLDKYWAGGEDVKAGRYLSSTNPPERLGQPVEPYESQEYEGNLLLLGGADILWLGLKAGLTATTNSANTYFNNANAGIRVSTSNTAAANTQTNIQGTTKFTLPMDATYPTHTTGTGTSTCSKIVYKGTATTAQGNFAWNEWGIVNRTAGTGGRMLNRKVQSLGTKSTAATWSLTVTLSLS